MAEVVLITILRISDVLTVVQLMRSMPVWLLTLPFIPMVRWKDYQKAIDYCDKIIDSNKYALCRNEKNGYSGYQQLFMGDNDKNPEAMKEIIFPIRQDGVKTRGYGGTSYLVNAPA